MQSVSLLRSFTDAGPDYARVNGVPQFFDSIHALSIAAQDFEGETSLQSTSVHVGPAKNIEKQKNRRAGTGLVYSRSSTGPDELITTMEPPKNDEHKADNLNSETAPPGSSRPISDESTEKDDENIQLRANAQEPDYAPQQDSSDIAQEQKEDFTGQPATDEDGFVSPVPEKGIMQVEQTIETPIEEGPESVADFVSPIPEKGIMQVEQTIETPIEEDPDSVADFVSPIPEKGIMQVEQTIETPIEEDPESVADFVSPVPEKGIMQVEQTIETPIEEDPVFSTIRENFYDAEAPDNMQRSDLSQEAESRGQDESGSSDSGEVEYRGQDESESGRSNSEEAEYREQGESQESDSDELRSGPRPDISAIPEETMQLVEEKPNTVEGRGDEGAEIAIREQEELKARSEDEEKQKSYDRQKSYTEKIYETASSAAQAVASKLRYGVAERQSEETDGVNEGNDSGTKGIVERVGGVVATLLRIKHQEEDGQQQEFPDHDMQEQEQEPEPAEVENVETDEPQFWDAEAENVETVEAQT